MAGKISVGLGGSIHDYATVVADQDSIVWGLEDERITRIRHNLGSKDPLRPSFYAACSHFPEIESGNLTIVANDTLSDVPLFEDIECEMMNHHLSHAYSVFFTSKFDEAVILIVDGAGSVTADHGNSHEREATTIYFGNGNSITEISSTSGLLPCPKSINEFEISNSNSLGDLYGSATEACGFARMQEGRTMALASYGDDRFLVEFLKRISLGENGQYSIDMHSQNGFLKFFADLRAEYGCGSKMAFDVKAAIARAAQEVVETVISHLLRWAYQETGCENLCIAGGVALNATVMGKLDKISPFKYFSTVSSPGDSGTAIGSAIYGQLKENTGGKARRWNFSPYIGPVHNETSDAENELNCVLEFVDIQEGADFVYDQLKSGKLVATFFGRSEFGPRALGNRSILACPSVPGITSSINKLKSREWFRPVSPAAIIPAREGYEQGESMMQCARTSSIEHFFHRPCVHVDGSARVQTIKEGSHDFLWSLLQCFDAGHQVVLNTSFNIGGEPIVETREQAVSTFLRSEIDFLVVEDRIYSKG
ncbi:carbamoyltransferase C-terminal domain-containing protein [uncultured Litoreibacter sp.]|uniref:carbamoyltransferase C-terminal domain-containing protein n=1 Tax=uncultured Litoreibacter sp. TaxID=1392394 RepID=UPI002611A9CA|nr:carbamoyltransferase C-terminal domain-containing protein [uncultured Litoreibacter sp.]